MLKKVLIIIILEIKLNYKIDQQDMILMEKVNILLFFLLAIMKELWLIILIMIIIKIKNGS
jgi:hypothetical protein